MLTDQVIFSSLLVDIIQGFWLHFAIFILFFFLLTQHNVRFLSLIIVTDKHMLLLLYILIVNHVTPCLRHFIDQVADCWVNLDHVHLIVASVDNTIDVLLMHLVHSRLDTLGPKILVSLSLQLVSRVLLDLPHDSSHLLLLAILSDDNGTIVLCLEMCSLLVDRVS